VPELAGRIDTALERVGGFVADTLADEDRRERLLAHPHAALAACGNLSLLWRRSGACVQAPFPWAELDHFRAPI
jgi:hypothetical protein